MGTVNHSDLATAADLHPCACRVNSGDPTGSVTPTYAYELLLDSDTNELYVATSTTAASWQAVSVPAREIGPTSGCPSYSLSPATDGVDATWGGLFGAAGNQTSMASRAATADAGFGWEAAGRPSNSTGYHRLGIATEQLTGDANGPRYDWYLKLPPEFTGWEEAGIRVLYEFSRPVGSDALNVTLEAMDPATFTAWGTPKIATDAYTGAQAPSYATWIQLTGTVLSTDYAASDVLLLRFEWDDPDAGAGSSGEFQMKVGQVEFHWTDQ